MDLQQHIQKRLDALIAERERRAVELAQFNAVIAELQRIIDLPDEIEPEPSENNHQREEAIPDMPRS